VESTPADDKGTPEALHKRNLPHESFESTCGVKQGDNLGLLFIFMIQAVSTMLDKKFQPFAGTG
jgi:hypothetical protein